MSQALHDKLRRAQDLLGHQIPSGDVVQVLDRALDALIDRLEKRKFGAADKPRKPGPRESKNPRQIPASIRRAVSQRDGGRCTFIGDSGHRCEARKMLEFDHISEVARGGRATLGNLRLRCRAHNQYTAEQTFGPGLMKARREDARRAAAGRERARAAAERERARAAAESERVRAAAEQERARVAAEEVVPWLRAMRIPADQARQAAQRCEAMPDASLEERVKAALSCFGPRDACLRRAAPA